MLWCAQTVAARSQQTEEARLVTVQFKQQLHRWV